MIHLNRNKNRLRPSALEYAHLLPPISQVADPKTSYIPRVEDLKFFAKRQEVGEERVEVT